MQFHPEPAKPSLKTPVINRSLHIWRDLLRLFCHILQIDTDGSDCKREARLITEARNLKAIGWRIRFIFMPPKKTSWQSGPEIYARGE